MESYFPPLNLKAKLMALMVVLLALTLGAEVIVSLGTQEAIVEATQEKVKDLAAAIQMSVQELTSVRYTDRDSLQDFQRNLPGNSLDEVTIASNENLIINSSNPSLIGKLLGSPSKVYTLAGPAAHDGHDGTRRDDVKVFTVGPPDEPTTIYQIPIKVEDYTFGYVRVRANFGNYAEPLRDSRFRLITFGPADFRYRAGFFLRFGGALRQADSCCGGGGAEYRGARARTGSRSASPRRDRPAHAQLQRDGRATAPRARTRTRS